VKIIKKRKEKIKEEKMMGSQKTFKLGTFLLIFIAIQASNGQLLSEKIPLGK
jgi:hypothetical protein